MGMSLLVAVMNVSVGDAAVELLPNILFILCGDGVAVELTAQPSLALHVTRHIGTNGYRYGEG